MFKMYNSKDPQVAIIMGSKTDVEIMTSATEVLDEFEIPYIAKILSAHRSPYKLKCFVIRYEPNITAFICGAGMAAHLAGVVASYTEKPVLGIPIPSSELRGMDSLLSTIQMPPGIPVATFGIGKSGAKNAALFVVRIIGTRDYNIKHKLGKYRISMEDKIEIDNDEIFGDEFFNKVK